MTIPEAFPEELVLSPESRWPLELPKSTAEQVLARPMPRAGCGRDRETSAAAEKRVSIVVVSFNNLVFNRLCLESVLANTDPGAYELLVVDNASNDGTADYLAELARLCPNVRIVLNSTNAGFAAAANQGLEAACGHALLLLNNDTIVPPGWLPRLLRGLDEPGVGMVGPVTNRCGNEAQIDTAWSTYGEFLECADERARLHHGETRDIRMLTMFCVALRREVYEEIGPLDERFEVGLFEDEDYSLRLRNAGYALHCLEDVLVHHFGQASIGKLAVSGEYGTLFHGNRKTFEDKWGLRWRPHGRRPNPGYRSLVGRIRTIIETRLPADSTVLVISKGDEDLLTVSGRAAWHFPQDGLGRYAGHYPESSKQAIEQLDRMINAGAQFLLIPETMFWWLEYYAGFGAYLADNYPCIQRDESCVVYQLGDLGPVQGDQEIQSHSKIHGAGRLNRRLLTVIVPAFGTHEALERCLEWLSKTGRHPQQWLIVGDSSGDSRIEDLLQQWAEKHDHIAYALSEEREGPVATLNTGLKLAPGDIVFLKPGCYPSHGWLESMNARAHGSAAVATVSPRADSGNCLLITRAAIRRAGLLDERRFKDLSGALADFRRRAAACDFENVVDPETRLFETASAARPGRRETGAPEQPCLLALVHSGGGGARFAAEDMVSALSPDFRCLLLSTGRSHWSLYENVEGGFRMCRHYAFPDPWQLDSALDDDRRGVLEEVCRTFGVDLVNIHHLLGNHPEAIGLFRKLELPVIFSFHDFYALCPTSHLVDDRQAYCGGVCTEGEGVCAVNRDFFRGSGPVLKHHYVHEHRRRMKSALAQCAAFTAPSLTVSERLEKFPGFTDPSKLRVIPHGGEVKRLRLAADPAHARPVRVLCPGNLNEAKGIGLIGQLMELNRAHGRPFEFHFLGAGQRGFRHGESGAIHHGPYRRDEFMQRVEKIRPSFSLLAPICEETWSFTLSECWAAGLPVFASDLGALKERIGLNGGGWLFEAGNAEAFYSGMVAVLENPAAWKRAVDAIRRTPLLSMADQAREFEQVFRQHLSKRSSVREEGEVSA